MKKLVILLSLPLFLLSCSKDYTCECSYRKNKGATNLTPFELVETHVVKGKNAEQAAANCTTDNLKKYYEKGYWRASCVIK